MKLNRRPRERTFLLTDEALAKVPQNKRSSEYYYDSELPYFVARKIFGEPRPDFSLILTKAQVRAGKAAGKNTTRFIRLGRIPASQARQLAIDTFNEFQKITLGGKLPIPLPKQMNYESILETKDPVPNPSYELLMTVLMDAYQQAANGKGSDRHGNGLNFEDQDLLEITDRVGIGFPLGQAIKKICEGQRLTTDLARKEFLGAIVYLAGAIIWMER